MVGKKLLNLTIPFFAVFTVLFVGLNSIFAADVKIGGTGYQCAGNETNRWKTENENVATLPNGYEFETIIVKHQDCTTVYPVNNGDGCYTISITGQTVTVNKIGSGRDCKNISHLEGTYKVTATPTPTPVTPPSTPSPTPDPTRTPRPTPSNTPDPTRTPTPTPSITPTPTPSSTPTPTPVTPPSTPSPTPSTTPTPSPSCPPDSDVCIIIDCPGAGDCEVTTGTPTPSPSVTPSPSSTPTLNPSATPTSNGGASSDNGVGGPAGSVLGADTLAYTGSLKSDVFATFAIIMGALAIAKASHDIKKVI